MLTLFRKILAHRKPAAPPAPNEPLLEGPLTRLLAKERSRWDQARFAASGGPHVLLATSTGGHPSVTQVESLLAMALTLRGARVSLLLCDAALPACEECMLIVFKSDEQFATEGPSSSRCPPCFGNGQKLYNLLGLSVLRYSSFLDDASRENAARINRETPMDDIPGYVRDGLKIGEHALAGALRFFARGTLEGEPYAEAVLRRYFEASLLTADVMTRIFTTQEIHCACFHHGIYVPHGITGETARKLNVRVVNWTTAYRKQRFIFSHKDTYHHTLLVEPPEDWQQFSFKRRHRRQAESYLKSRWSGSRDWIYFHEKPTEDPNAISREIGMDLTKPTILLLTNVIWDAQLHYPANAFPNMIVWLIETIRYFAKRPELNLVIRVHPAEIRGGLPSRQLAADEIRRNFPELPSNVHIVAPDQDLSTYALAELCNAAIIYGTKTGVELTSMGIPVIVAGEAWIKNKGLTKDPASAEEYFATLDQLPLPGRLDEEERNRALKYAYHFFFRRMIPIKGIEVLNGWPPFRANIQTLKELSASRNPGLETICKGILLGKSFVHPAENFANEDI
jgi:capsular polysaccharide biosynthesis protein